MRSLILALVLAASPGLPLSAATLELSIRDGRVSLDAQDVTTRQILAEWARVGRTRIVNIERIQSGPLTLRFENVPERQALDTILRAVPGYIAAPRSAYLQDASIYDRILIMATTTAVAAVRPPSAPLQGPTTLTRLRPGAPPLTPGELPEPNEPRDDSQGDPAIAAAAAAGLVAVPAAQPGLTTITMPLTMPGAAQAPAQAPTAAPSNPWNAPVGSTMPGLAPPPPPESPNQSPARPPQGDQ